VNGYYALSRNGKMSEADAQREALARLATMRYGESGYLFVMDSKPVVLMHPTLPQMTGKPVGDFKDPDGKLLYVAIVDAAKASGRGFAQYRGRLPHSETAVPKVSYVVRFAPWDWNITSGVFIKDIDTVYYQTLLGHLAVVLLIGALISLAMVLIIRNVRASLGGEPEQAARLAANIAQGDLTQAVAVRPHDKTSMMAAMHEMQSRLQRTIGEIRSSAESIASATQQIAAGNGDLSQRTEQQAASLQETAASMEELTATVKQNADNARQASGLAHNASEIATRGNDVVSRVIDTMGEINESSRQIADIIGVIEGIAFQTNILALNAAVEAARAGEQGRGFAVVAGEVRSLAQRSGTAAKEIKQLIGASVERVHNGSTLVQQAGATMGEILQAVQRVTDIMGEIAAASEEQSGGISQVGRAVTQMDEVTQQNAALVEQAAAAAASLQDQARRLRDTVSAFRVNGADAVAERPAAVAARRVTAAVQAGPKREAGATGRMQSAARAEPQSVALKLSAPVASATSAASTKPAPTRPVAADAKPVAADDDWTAF
jgi:methyl-accepting chemotaxis protein